MGRATSQEVRGREGSTGRSDTGGDLGDHLGPLAGRPPLATAGVGRLEPISIGTPLAGPDGHHRSDRVAPGTERLTDGGMLVVAQGQRRCLDALVATQVTLGPVGCTDRRAPRHLLRGVQGVVQRLATPVAALGHHPRRDDVDVLVGVRKAEL